MPSLQGDAERLKLLLAAARPDTDDDVHFMLGEHAPAGTVMTDVWPSIALNLILTAPVYALARRLLRPLDWADRAQEVRLLG